MDTHPHVEERMPSKAPPYDDAIVRLFVLATFVWGVIGMLVGLVLALQLVWWPANTEWAAFSFGRLRPVHTNAVIFAFAGNAIFAAVYHSTQRLCRVRMFSDVLSKVHFWGWQILILVGAVTLMAGMTQGKEYAELIWPLDIVLAVIWVIFAVNFFGTLARRRAKHIYVALWFYIASIITVAVLHIVNSLALPATLTRSYPITSGMTDALIQWWYGHNAVAFVLTTPFLGLMYYYLPKAANRPVYSYRLSIVHFWALIFIYIWAGPHHLLYSAIPDWAQTLGSVFSIMLLAPSWGGMINGLLTLRGAWDRVRSDAVLKFFVIALTFYGMATFEGPMLSIRPVNALAHKTDWVIAHVHAGALGWVGMITFGMMYWMIPRLWGHLYSRRLMDAHFWLATVGILLYCLAIWTAGITQGLQWRALTDYGTLAYPSFIDTVTALMPFYWARVVGGLLYFVGVLLMGWNLFMSIRTRPPANATSAEVNHG